MGEYAIRLRDRANIKIGTCECMYYCRHDQIKDVIYKHPTDGLMWRIPTPDEDGIQVGDFEYGGLVRQGQIPYHLSIDDGKISPEMKDFLESHKGTIQIVDNKSGIMVQSPCYHGIRLPDESENATFFWHQKKKRLHLCFLENSVQELLIGIRCASCQKMFSASFDEVEPLMKSLWMKLRLLHQCSEYWKEKNKDKCRYSVTDRDYCGRPISIKLEDEWIVTLKDHVVITGSWEECRDWFISQLSDVNSECLNSEDYEYYVVNMQMKERYLKNKIV